MILLIWFSAFLYGPEVQVEFNNLREAKGDLYVAVYDRSETFLSLDRVHAKKIVPIRQTGTVRVSFGGLSSGKYAISCFHDLNGNGKLDTNLFGIPTEPYGFSNNVRPKFRAPNWMEAAFDLYPSGRDISVRLERW